KVLVRANIELGSHLSLIGDFFGLTYYQNSGAAFGIFQDGTAILALISALFASGCLLLFLKPNIIPQLNNVWGNAGLTLLFSGSVGNLIDRIFLGFVTDWIKLGPIPNFNVADGCVTVGVILLLIFVLLPELFKKEQRHA
ncbi:MAG: signal peptidase II, partial [Chloroflexi bacterium]|nr:signal peptidase II [Chloroflexota bacterium]